MNCAAAPQAVRTRSTERPVSIRHAPAAAAALAMASPMPELAPVTIMTLSLSCMASHLLAMSNSTEQVLLALS